MFVVGKVLKPQGRNGEVKAEIITSFPNHFNVLKELFVDGRDGWQAYSIKKVRIRDKFVFIKFAEINTIDQAELVRNKYLYIREDDLHSLGDNEFYYHDIIGMQVQDGQGNIIGTVTDIESYPANDIYIVKSADKKYYSIPAILDVIVKVDKNKKRIIINVLDGLFD